MQCHLEAKVNGERIRRLPFPIHKLVVRGVAIVVVSHYYYYYYCVCCIIVVVVVGDGSSVALGDRVVEGNCGMVDDIIINNNK